MKNSILNALDSAIKNKQTKNPTQQKTEKLPQCASVGAIPFHCGKTCKIALGAWQLLSTCDFEAH